jgi:UDP-N-acetyl-D-glucosamine/UDP-N-acetyl-D-galactosamine dehydrogenase
MNLDKVKIAVFGLGYVGLPLAIEFSKKYSVIGFDINSFRVDELNSYKDITNEVESENIETQINNKSLLLTSDLINIKNCNIYIVTVPTPVDENKIPDLTFILNASKQISQNLKKGDIVIYESTVYPGCTEEECVPVLEKHSNLKYNKDFYCGYSPERINPGDKINTLTKIKKVTSGSNKETAKQVNKLYQSIIDAGTYMAPSIKIAEASKSIENAQRDLNISFMNELAIIFDKMEIDTNDVLEAAGTKWNFLNFKPGIVGGHCIGVDPYYLTYKSKKLGYDPKVILSGREVNDNMGNFIGQKVISLMTQNNLEIKGSKVLILGITFKEDCPDIRNSKVIDIYNHLINNGLAVDIHDSCANFDNVLKELNIKLISNFDVYDAIILAVAHRSYKSLEIDNLRKNKKSIVYDVKGIIDRKIINDRL